MPAEGIEPGSRECHDAQKGRLLVDFVYPDARPRPIALEVTSIVDDAFLAGAKATDAAIGRLTALAEKEKWGSWLVVVVAIERVKRLEPIIADVIRDALPMREKLLARGWGIRPNPYTSDDLLRLPSRKAQRKFIERHREVKAMGLEEVKPVESKLANVVAVLPFSGTRVFGPFNDELALAVGDNAKKLGYAQGLERHLAVLVDRFDLLPDPDTTPPPTFPPVLDCLWGCPPVAPPPGLACGVGGQLRRTLMARAYLARDRAQAL